MATIESGVYRLHDFFNESLELVVVDGDVTTDFWGVDRAIG
jgi:hypothetical protein